MLSTDESSKLSGFSETTKPAKGIGYSYHASFVGFYFSLGCRPSEESGYNETH